MKLKALLLLLFVSLSFSKDLNHVALYEHLGKFVPKNVVVYDTKGIKHKLGDLIKDRPTLVTFNYYTCPVVCSTQIANVAQTLQDTKLVLGKDYNILTISIDPEDTKYDAQRYKDKALSVLVKPGAKNWKFLYVGDYKKVREITNAFGFGFERSKKKVNGGRYQYYHPTFVTVLSRDGMITRYLDGVYYSPFNIKLAVYEAIKGQISPTVAVKKALSYCFTSQQGGGYAFNYIKVLLYAVMIVAALFLLYLVLTSRKKDGKNVK